MTGEPPIPHHALPILLLGAGQSRRMRGVDKLIEDAGGQPLLRRQADRARSATEGPVLVTLPPPPHPRHDALGGLDVTPVPVPDAAEGMAASLRAGFAALPPGVPAAMILLADLPDLTTSDLKNVLQAVDLKSETLVWRGATSAGAPGHPIVVAAPLFAAFARLTGDSGGQEVIRAAEGRVRLVPLPGDRARRDLDTPEDWATWRAEQAARNPKAR